MSCSAFGCTKRQSKDSAISFFRFPFRDEFRLIQWTKNVRRKNWTPTRSSRLCSAHFEDSQFFIDKMGKRRLKDNALPSIFNFPMQYSGKKIPILPPLPVIPTVPRGPRVSRIPVVPVVTAIPVVPVSVITAVPALPVIPDVPDFPDFPDFSPITEETMFLGRIIKVSPDSTPERTCSAPLDLSLPTRRPPVVADMLPDIDVKVFADLDHKYHSRLPYISNVVGAADTNSEGSAEAHENIAEEIPVYNTSGDPQAVLHDHCYPGITQQHVSMCSEQCFVLSESVRTLTCKVGSLQNQLIGVRKKLRIKCQQTRRLTARLLRSKSLVKVLQKQMMLEALSRETTLETHKRFMKQVIKKKKKTRFITPGPPGPPATDSKPS